MWYRYIHAEYKYFPKQNLLLLNLQANFVPQTVKKLSVHTHRAGTNYWHHGCTNVPKIWKPPQNSRRQEGNMKQILYRTPTNIRRHETNIVSMATWRPGASLISTVTFNALLFNCRSVVFRNASKCISCALWRQLWQPSGGVEAGYIKQAQYCKRLYIFREHTKQDKMCRICSMYCGNERCANEFSRNP